MNITLILGGRPGQATTKAVIMAEKYCGRNVPDPGASRGIMAPTKARATEAGKTWRTEARSVRAARPDQNWKAIVFIDAQKMSKGDFIRSLTMAKDSRAAVFIAAALPIPKSGQWVLDLLKVDAIVAAVTA